MSAGTLVTIEGIDGAGKTTLAHGLSAELERRGIRVTVLREPGGVRVAERIREIVKDPALPIGPIAEALLYAAARAQLVEELLRPSLAAGDWILLDRFVDSSLAYQGAGRGLGIEAVREVNRLATGGLYPDRTLLLSLESRLALSRARAREEPVDRLEREQHEFFARIEHAYLELAAHDPARIRTIDATLPPEEVLRRALAELSDLI